MIAKAQNSFEINELTKFIYQYLFVYFFIHSLYVHMFVYTNSGFEHVKKQTDA